MALLTVSDLAVGFNAHAVVQHLNFTVNAGDYLCIVGENGSGKSTLMRTLLNLQEAVSGQIITGDGLKKNEIGYLPQQTLVQKDFPASVREIVLSGCQGRCGLRPFYSKEEKKLAEDNMERMGISSLSGRCYRELSGGQQQRVLLARALCATRKILLLDEPVSGLDPLVTAQMYSLIEELNGEGITIIMISHDIGAAVRYASHILHIGHSVFFGTKAEYLKSEIGRFFMLQQEEAQKVVAAASSEGPAAKTSAKSENPAAETSAKSEDPAAETPAKSEDPAAEISAKSEDPAAETSARSDEPFSEKREKTHADHQEGVSTDA